MTSEICFFHLINMSKLCLVYKKIVDMAYVSWYVMTNVWCVLNVKSGNCC